MMFAAVPVAFVYLGWGFLGCVSIILARLAWKWFIRDSHRDMIIFMGPKMQGKTEFASALRKEEFDPDRPVTGKRLMTFKIDDIGYKKIVTCDSAGEEKNISDYTKKLVQLIDEKRPEFVLIVLVISKNFIDTHTPSSIAEDLGQYLDYLTEACKNDLCKGMQKRYKDGYWAYAIAITHCDKPTNKEQQCLTQVIDAIDEYKGYCRQMTSCFSELSNKKGRGGAIRWIVSLLKKIHEG